MSHDEVEGIVGEIAAAADAACRPMRAAIAIEATKRAFVEAAVSAGFTEGQAEFLWGIQCTAVPSLR